jgi:hypothetical protein
VAIDDPRVAGGVRHRHCGSHLGIPARATRDEDVNNDAEIAAVVTLTPTLPTTKTSQSATVVVNAPSPGPLSTRSA